MECAPIRAQAWLDGHESELVDRPLGEVVALIEDAGLVARVIPLRSGWLTQEQHRDRVNLRLTAAGEIGSIDAG